MGKKIQTKRNDHDKTKGNAKIIKRKRRRNTSKSKQTKKKENPTATATATAAEAETNAICEENVVSFFLLERINRGGGFFDDEYEEKFKPICSEENMTFFFSFVLGLCTPI